MKTCNGFVGRGLASLLAAVAVCATAQAYDKTESAEIGKPAPQFELKSTDGKTVKLSDFKGKVVVLEWTNHQCPVVNQYVVKKKAMQKTFDRFKDKPVAWLGIDSSHFCEDSIDAINEFRKENGIEYPTLLDASGKIGKMYGATNTPHMFVIDKEGNLAYMGSMDDDRYGDKESPRNYVAEAVESLVNGSTVAVSRTKPFGCSVKYKQ